MDFKPTTIAEFQCHAIETILKEFPNLKTGGFNSRIEGRIATPAIFLELTEFSYPDNVAPDDCSLDCQFSLKLMGSSLVDDPVIQLEDLAIKISRFIRGNRWGIYAEPAIVISSTSDDFSPHDEAYRVWEIRFNQSIAIKGHQFMLQQHVKEEPQKLRDGQ